jgi:hypothetical protein
MEFGEAFLVVAHDNRSAGARLQRVAVAIAWVGVYTIDIFFKLVIKEKGDFEGIS